MNSKDFPDFENLLDKLAEQVHIAWMKKRINDGWSYGKERNDTKKTTPCIVPYEELPESEKEYDKETARTVINALIALGYSISRTT